MPYYIYQIQNPSSLKYLDQRDRYQDAKILVRNLREKQAAANVGMVRLVFASSTGEAEKLLSLPRDNRIIGED